MYDVRGTKHVGCGGTFREVNIYEDIACDLCGEGSERYIMSREEREAAEDAREQRELEARIESEQARAEEIGVMYVLMKIIPYEGECLQGVYVSDEQARRATGAPASCFQGISPDFRIHRVPVGADPKYYFS